MRVAEDPIRLRALGEAYVEQLLLQAGDNDEN